MSEIFLILHRDLGSADENASDIEQGSKILYYHPASTTLNDQLNTCNLVEGIIDFFQKFAEDGDAPDVIFMHKRIWSICRCDGPSHNVYMVMSLPSQEKIELPMWKSQENGNSDGKSVNTSYSTGMHDTIVRMYRLYMLWHPRISDSLAGKDRPEVDDSETGWKMIEIVQILRKKIRKSFEKLQQLYLDLETMKNYEDEADIIERTEESLGIRRGTVSIDEIMEEITSIKKSIQLDNSELDSITLNPTKYTPEPLRESLKVFVNWFLSAGEHRLPSTFHGLTGSHFLPVGFPAFQVLLQVRQAVEESSKRLSKGL